MTTDISTPAVRSGEVREKLHRWAFAHEYYANAYVDPAAPFPDLKPAHDDCIRALQEGALLIIQYLNGEVRSGEVDARGLEAAKDLVIATARRINSGPYEDVRMTGALAALDAALTATDGGDGDSNGNQKAEDVSHGAILPVQVRVAQHPDAEGMHQLRQAEAAQAEASQREDQHDPDRAAKEVASPDTAGGDGVEITEEMVETAAMTYDTTPIDPNERHGQGHRRAMRSALAAALRHARRTERDQAWTATCLRRLMEAAGESWADWCDADIGEMVAHVEGLAQASEEAERLRSIIQRAADEISEALAWAWDARPETLVGWCKQLAADRRHARGVGDAPEIGPAHALLKRIAQASYRDETGAMVVALDEIEGDIVLLETALRARGGVGEKS